MRHHYSPPQFLFSSPPISPLTQHFVFRPPPFLSYSSHLPPPSAPSHTITCLFFLFIHFILHLFIFLLLLLLLFSLYSSLYLLSFFPSHLLLALPSLVHLSSLSSPSFLFLRHPVLLIHRPVIFFFVALLLLPALLFFLVYILICLLFFFFSHSLPPPLVPGLAGKVGCEKLKTLCALGQLTKPRYAHTNIYLGQVDPPWGKLSRGTSCPKLCGSTCPIMTQACPQRMEKKL